MGTGLNKLREEDPSFVVERNTETRQTLLGGQGDIQLGLSLPAERQIRRKVKTVPQKIAYQRDYQGNFRRTGKHKTVGPEPVSVRRRSYQIFSVRKGI